MVVTGQEIAKKKKKKRVYAVNLKSGNFLPKRVCKLRF